MAEVPFNNQIQDIPVTNFGIQNVVDSPIVTMKNDIVSKAKSQEQVSDFYKDFQKNKQPNSLDSLVDRRVKLSDYRVDVNEAYKRLSDGEYVPIYKNFIQGTDNNERLAQQQTTGEKWTNGITKALSKTGSAVVGGTAGLVYGLGAALSEGSRSAIYDNDFSNKLNDWDTKLNYQLPNYYTKQEQDKNLFGQMGTANFWSDKFLGGLSFTAGAIISEAIWAAATGGTSLAARGAMLGTKLARWASEGIGEAGVIAGMSKYKSWLKNIGTTAMEVGEISKTLPNTLGKVGEVFSVTGQLARSAGYEASVEALQFKKEAEENFYNNFSDINGREPNAEDISKFNNDLADSANGVFATNMAILMPSNLITLGHVLDIKSPIKLGLTEFLDKKAFGYGLAKTAEGTFQKLAPTTSQKVARGLFNYAVKPGLTEGVFEEGLQGVTTKFGNKWVENTYNTKNTAQTFDSIDAIGKSMAEQYGTKEGLVDVGLGVLIGMFGSSMNVRGENKEREKELDYKLSVSNAFADQNLFAKNLINHKIQTANRITGFSEEAKAEEEKGNIVKSQLNRNSAILSFINSKQVLGESLSDTSKEVRQSLNSLTEEQWGDAGISPENIEQEKEDRINEFESLSKQWKANKTYWTYMLGGKLAGEQNLETTGLEKSLGGSFSKNAAIIEAFTWQSTIGENSHTLIKDAQEVVGRELGAEQAKTLSIKNSLLKAGQDNLATIKRLEAEHNANILERDKLTEDIVKLNSAPKETEGNKVIGNKLLEAQKRLLEVNKNISDIQRESQEIADKINITEAQEQNLNSIDVSQAISGTTISGSDLLKLSENINKFKATLDFIATSNPQRYQYLDGILKEYSDAEEVFLQHKATQKAILSPDFKIDRIEGWIRGKVSAKKAMNENTQEWLQDALDSYTKNKAEFISDLLSSEEATNIVSESDYEDFTENDNVSDEILAKIANKKEKGEALDSKENEIYNSREKEINEIIAKSNTETKPKSEQQILKEKIAELEQERDNKIANIEPITVENNPDQTEEIKKLEEEYNQKISDLEQEKADLLEELKTKPQEVVTSSVEGGKSDTQETLDNAEYKTKSDRNVIIRLPIDIILSIQEAGENVKRGQNGVDSRIDKIKKFLKSKPSKLEASLLNINKDNSVGIDGRHRLEAAKEMGATHAMFEIKKSDEQLLQKLINEATPQTNTPDKTIGVVGEGTATIEDIKSVLTQEEQEVLEQVIEENKSEGQTDEEFIQEEVKKELNGEKSNLKGSSTLIDKFRALIRKLAKIFAIGAIMWSTANPMADFLGRNDIVTREKGALVVDIINSPGTITENSFTPSQLKLLRVIIEDAKSKGQNYVTYELNYPTGQDGVKRNGKNVQVDIFNSSDEIILKRTLGAFSFVEIDGNYIISDRYNFNDHVEGTLSEKVNYLSKALEQKSSYEKIRGVASVFGSANGEGAFSKITIPTKENSQDSPQKASLAGLGLLGLLRLKKQKGEPLTEEDLSNGKDRIAEIDDEILRLKQELADKKLSITPIKTEPNTEAIEKVKQEYTKKIKDLQPETRTNLEIYRDVLENLISNVYRGVNHMPSNAEEARATKPTEEDIKKYRELRKSKQTKSAEYKELENKLKSWKLLASAVDENYTSIAEIINLIEQLETEQQKEDTKVVVTEDEAKIVLRDDTGTGEKRVDQSLLQNQNGHATVHNVKNSGKYTFSHIEAAYIVNQLGGDFEVKRDKKILKNPNLRDLEVGDIISIDNMSFTFTFGGTLEMKISDFEARQQVLNMYVNPIKTGSWTYLDVYTTKGNERVKMPSQFNENIKQKEIYNEKEGNELSLHIDNADGWNDTEKGGTKEGLKLYFKNKKGDNISVAKAGKDAKSTSFDQRFENMRLVAYDRWIAQGKPNTLDLGITATIDNIFFGSAELLMDEEGRVLNVPITESEAENIITAKGYVLNGEVKLDREVKDVNLTFAGKLSKDNPTLKVPIIVFKKGVHNIAFPITMNKTNTPVEFDAILKSGKTPNEIILAINEAIIKNNIKTPKLVYADLTNEEKLGITREAFTNKQSYVSADTLASSGYAKSNLSGDALINIDLSNLDNAISSPKIRIDLDSIELGKITDFKNETKTDIENSLNDIAKEIENVNLKQYVDKKGNAIENNFTDFIGENPTVEVNNQLNKVTNLNILRGYLALAPKSFRMLFGEDKINFAKNAILRYDSFSKQTDPKDEDKKSGKKQTNCKE